MLFSVIVPVYKVENYLRECVDSILAQTFSDFELILVDDGSPDGCHTICDDCAKQDSRIKVIHKHNGGSTSARKEGLNLACGEYILCVDGDDCIDGDLLKRISDVLLRQKYDIVCFGYFTFPNKVKKCEINVYRDGSYNKSQIKSDIFPTLITGENGQRFPPSIWGKAFKRELVLPIQNALPNDIIIGEDSCISYVTIFQAENLYIIHDELYHYRINSDSLTRSKKIFSWQEALQRAKFYLTYMPEEQFGEQVARVTAHSFFNVAVSILRAKKYKEAKREIKKMLCDERVAKILQQAKFKANKKEKIALNCLRRKKVFLMKLLSMVA
ncbi:MAG: glycosyltransferase family 2 protein [Clostridia bacterium]|nr:glycosyltransferase family 2 protein [Clostridia bacterium]